MVLLLLVHLDLGLIHYIYCYYVQGKWLIPGLIIFTFPLFYFIFFSGSMQFPYNPLTMRILSNTPPTSIASPSIQSQQQQPPSAGAPVAQQRVWQSLLSEQYETLSDSDDWELLIRVLRTARDICTDVYLLSPPPHPLPELSLLASKCDMLMEWCLLFWIWCYGAPWLLQGVLATAWDRALQNLLCSGRTHSAERLDEGLIRVLVEDEELNV